MWYGDQVSGTVGVLSNAVEQVGWATTCTLLLGASLLPVYLPRQTRSIFCIRQKSLLVSISFVSQPQLTPIALIFRAMEQNTDCLCVWRFKKAKGDLTQPHKAPHGFLEEQGSIGVWSKSLSTFANSCLRLYSFPHRFHVAR